MADKCVDHLNFTGGVCPDCSLPVDDYGNTEDSFDFCAFPDCGCDGNRLCMAANGASDRAFEQNVEGMWTAKTAKQRKAVFALVGSLAKKTDTP